MPVSAGTVAYCTSPERCPSWLKERDWKSRNGGFPRSRVRIPPSPLASVITKGERAGSLSSDLRYQACGAAGERPSLLQVSAIGVLLVPLTLAGSLAAL